MYWSVALLFKVQREKPLNTYHVYIHNFSDFKVVFLAD